MLPFLKCTTHTHAKKYTSSYTSHNECPTDFSRTHKLMQLKVQYIQNYQYQAMKIDR